MILKVILASLILIASAYSLRYSASSEIQVPSNTNNDQSRPQVTVLENGSFVVVWESGKSSCQTNALCPGTEDGSNDGIFAKIFNSNGSNITSQFQVNQFTQYYQGNPTCASLNQGDSFVILWMSYSQDSSELGIFMRIFYSNGTSMTNETQVNTYYLSNQEKPVVSSFNAGSSFIVTWQSNQDGSGNGIYAKRFNSRGMNISLEFRVNDYTNSEQISPFVSSTESVILIAWQSGSSSCDLTSRCPGTQDGSNYGVFAKIYDFNGLNLTSEFQVNSYTTLPQTDPRIAASVDGLSIMFTWQGFIYNAIEWGVFGRIFNPNGIALTSEFQINDYQPGDQSQSYPGALQRGIFIVTWHSSSNQDGSNYGIFANFFGPNGTNLTKEFQVNIFTTNSQFYPGIAIFQDRKSFVVTWQSDNQDESGFGVYARIFKVQLCDNQPEYYYTLNSTCLSSCSGSGFKIINETGNFLYCDFACPLGSYFYTRNQTCSPSCLVSSGHVPINQSNYLYCGFSCAPNYYYYPTYNICLPYCSNFYASNYSNYLYCSFSCPQGQYYLISNNTCLSSCLSQEGFFSQNFSGNFVCKSSCVKEWNYKCSLNTSLFSSTNLAYNDEEVHLETSLSSNYQFLSSNYSWVCKFFQNSSGTYQCTQLFQEFFSSINTGNTSIIVPFSKNIVNETSVFQICVNVSWNFGYVINCTNITIKPTYLKFSFYFYPEIFYYTQKILFEVIINQSNTSSPFNYTCSISPSLPYLISQNILMIIPNNYALTDSDSYLQIMIYDGPYRASLPIYIPINHPPRGGRLIIQPQSGFFYFTEFCFFAVDWIDDDLPLQYRLSYNENSPIYINDFGSVTSWQAYFAIFSPNLTNITMILEVKDKFLALSKIYNFTLAQIRPISEFIANPQDLVSILQIQNNSISQLVSTISFLSSQVNNFISNQSDLNSTSASGCPYCSGNGLCNNSVCVCYSGWKGQTCSVNEITADKVSQINNIIINQISNILKPEDNNGTSLLFDSLAQITNNPNYNSPQSINQLQDILDRYLNISYLNQNVSSELSKNIYSLLENILNFRSIQNCNFNLTNSSINTLEKTIASLDKIANSITSKAYNGSINITKQNYELNVISISVCDLNNFTLRTNNELCPDVQFDFNLDSLTLNCSQNVSIQYLAMNSNLFSCNSSAPKFLSSTTIKVINTTTGKELNETVVKLMTVSFYYKDPNFVRCSSSCALEGLVCRCTELSLLDMKSQILSIFSNSKLNNLNFKDLSLKNLVSSGVFWTVITFAIIFICFIKFLRKYEEKNYAQNIYDLRHRVSLCKRFWVSLLVMIEFYIMSRCLMI